MHIRTVTRSCTLAVMLALGWPGGLTAFGQDVSKTPRTGPVAAGRARGGDAMRVLEIRSYNLEPGSRDRFHWQMSIWYRRTWSTTIKATVDGLIYALLTAGTFGWLWPR
jgi:hypothetical protein